jgi:adenylate kinase
MKIIVFGAPGAGKGTQASLLAKTYKLKHLSVGDILREEIKKGTTLGKSAEQFVKTGRLVPDRIVNQLIKKALSNIQNFVLEGYPRNLAQAKVLDKICRIELVLSLEVSTTTILKRLTKRRICRKCNAIYHLNTKPPHSFGLCDLCGSELYQRDDDKEEVLRKRLEIYQQQTKPLLAYYKSLKKLTLVNGEGSREEIFERIKAILAPRFVVPKAQKQS